MNPADNNLADNIERSVEKLHITTRAETDKRILDDAFAALEKSTQKQSPHVGRSVWQRTLRNRMAEFAAVAAVVLVIFALFFGTPAAEAVALGEIYEALGKIRNICISSFAVGRAKPIQEIWTSQTLKVKLLKTPKKEQIQFVLWDIPNRVKMIRYLSSDTVQTEVVSEEMLAKAERAIGHTFGLVPFSDINDVPKGAQWSRVEDPQVAAVVPGTEVYDLTWLQESTTGTVVRFCKWRVFVDMCTNLPKRAEWYSKLKSGEEYKFETFSVVTYPNESQIKVLIRNAFGSALRQPGDPEYIGTPGAERNGAGRRR
ncbi:MAG: hypothetical protein IIB56_08475 [Planctomycetes bacterium]|nr:hypothetical protein [Planctomycetota bacterium]